MYEIDNYGIAPDKHFEKWDESRPKEPEAPLHCCKCGKDIHVGDVAFYIGGIIKEFAGVSVNDAWLCQYCGENLIEETEE